MELVLLAAGKSERLGMPKGLYPWLDRTWLEHQIEIIQTTSIERIILVLGYHERAYRAVVSSEVDIVVNPKPERGTFSSIQVGLRHARSPFVFVHPMDVPFVAEVVAPLSEAARFGFQAVIPRYDSRGGHPVVLSKSFSQTLLKLPCDLRLDHEIRRIPLNQRCYIDSPSEAIRLNLNTKSDFQAAADCSS